MDMRLTRDAMDQKGGISHTHALSNSSGRGTGNRSAFAFCPALDPTLPNGAEQMPVLPALLVFGRTVLPLRVGCILCESFPQSRLLMRKGWRPFSF
jgi:hypothetical protein